MYGVGDNHCWYAKRRKLWYVTKISSMNKSPEKHLLRIESPLEQQKSMIATKVGAIVSFTQPFTARQPSTHSKWRGVRQWRSVWCLRWGGVGCGTGSSCYHPRQTRWRCGVRRRAAPGTCWRGLKCGVYRGGMRNGLARGGGGSIRKRRNCSTSLTAKYCKDHHWHRENTSHFWCK